MSDIRDPTLAGPGARRIEWAAEHAPVLRRVRERIVDDASLRGRLVGVVLALEPKTAFLACVLADAGADVVLTCNAAMTNDDVAAALDERGVTVFARSDASPDDEQQYYAEVLARHPEVVIDDMAELIRLAHLEHPHALADLRGATEETTSGVSLLRTMASDGALRVPCIAANDARCKHLFDNKYGSGQSVLSALMDTTNLLIAGTAVLIVGYGWVGRGLARVARGLGARVTVAEVDPVAALEAHHDGHEIATVSDACERADWVITATGCRRALPMRAIGRCKPGVVLANAGGPSDEIDVDGLRAGATVIREVRPHVVEYALTDGPAVLLVGDGRCVNLSAGEGHPIEIMDLTFSIQVLAARHLALHGAEMGPGLHPLPTEIDDAVAREKLATLGVEIDELTPDQRAAAADWQRASSA